jgi:hypothetical protein
MNKLQLAAHFGISRQFLGRLIRKGYVYQDAHGVWHRRAAKNGPPSKLRERYVDIGRQLGYSYQTISRMHRAGRLVDTGESWQIVDKLSS